MHYQRLLLDDFGIFQGARMENLDTGLVVIAGPQRAGKTTFMEALRRIGYSIGRGDEVPPANSEYRLDAELVHEGSAYRLGLTGYANPSLSPLDRTGGDGNVPSTDNIFGGLSKAQYRQLYTLSLDQLKRLPPTIEEPEDLSRILLGAAYGSIAELPRMKEHFGEKAHDIGRSKGHPRYGRFSEAFERIEMGTEALRSANEQVETHNEKQDDLEGVQARLAEIRTEEDTLNTERQRLNVVLQYLEDFHTYRQLDEMVGSFNDERVEAFPENGLERADALQDDYETATEDVEAARDNFIADTSVEDPAKHREDLLAISEEIAEYHGEVSGWRERLRTIRETAEKLQERRERLETRIGQLSGDWDNSFEAVTAVETDLVQRDAVEQTVDSVIEARETVSDLEAELDGKRQRKSKLESQLGGMSEGGGSQPAVLLVAGAGLLAILAAIGLAVLVSPVVGVVAGGLVLLIGTALGIYLGGGTAGESERTQLHGQLNTVEQDLAELEERHQTATEKLEDAESRLETVRSDLDVTADLSPAGVSTFYESVVDLQSDIQQYKNDAKRHRERKQELEAELRAVADTIQGVESFEWDDDNPLDHADSLFAAVDRAAEAYELAEAWKSALTEQRLIEDDIFAFIGEWDRAPVAINDEEADDRSIEAALREAIREGGELAEYESNQEEWAEIRQDILSRFRVDAIRDAFAAVSEPPDEGVADEWCLDVFEMVADRYADREEIETRLDAIESKEDELQVEEEELQEARAELKQELEELASEDDLIEARHQIQTGSRTIERLAEEYATYRIAEYITEELQDRFIEETTGPLLDEASEILARITDEYDGLEHTGELENLDFRVVSDGTAELGSSKLSRATAEQLFMAVRLARIRQIETALPVVLDDALTNFDPSHGARTFGLIDDLAQTNQVFFLTAHPAFVELASEYADVDQFWFLEDGRFDGPFDDSGHVTTDLQPEPRIRIDD